MPQQDVPQSVLDPIFSRFGTLTTHIDEQFGDLRTHMDSQIQGLRTHMDTQFSEVRYNQHASAFVTDHAWYNDRDYQRTPEGVTYVATPLVRPPPFRPVMVFPGPYDHQAARNDPRYIELTRRAYGVQVPQQAPQPVPEQDVPEGSGEGFHIGGGGSSEFQGRGGPYWEWGRS